MKISLEPGAFAWQPLTPWGVATFAEAKAGRLWLVQSIVAALAAFTIIWFLHSNWYPAIQTAVRHLPASGEIRGARLDWRGAPRVGLAQGGYLAISVNVAPGARVERTADVELVFRENGIKACSLLGCMEMRYPPGWVIAFNRRELEPWLGAWEPVILGGVAVGFWVGLMLVWQVLAFPYCLVARAVAYYSNRATTLMGSWRLSGAALMPGTLVFSLAIIGYGLNLIDAVRFLLALILHFVVGWVYLVVSPLLLPGTGAIPSARTNPFAGSSSRAEIKSNATGSRGE